VIDVLSDRVTVSVRGPCLPPVLLVGTLPTYPPCLSLPCPPSPMAALLLNALLWTWDANVQYLGQPLHNQHLVIRNGFISEVLDQLPVDQSQYDTIIDVQGQLVLPGLIDSHVHVSLLGESQYYIDLHHCTSIEELRQTIAGRLPSLEHLPFIIGFNWDQTLLGRFPTSKDLDDLSTTKPVRLYKFRQL
jgi:predicted amidohydrolase YtcJ